jgi:anti-anti-sigma factor
MTQPPRRLPLSTTGHEGEQHGGSNFHVEVHDGDGKCRIELSGELDLATAPIAEAEVERALKAQSAGIEIDLGELEFIDSIGIALLLSSSAQADEAGIPLVMFKGSERVQETLRMCQAEERLPFKPRA